MIPSEIKSEFVWSTNTPMRPRSELAPGDGVISGIFPWGYMRSNRVVLLSRVYHILSDLCLSLSLLCHYKRDLYTTV